MAAFSGWHPRAGGPSLARSAGWLGAVGVGRILLVRTGRSDDGPGTVAPSTGRLYRFRCCPCGGSTFVEGVPVVYRPFPVVIVLSVAGVPTCWLPVMVPVTSWLPFAPSPLAASVAVATPVASTRRETETGRI